MIKLLFKVLPILAALFISSPSLAQNEPASEVSTAVNFASIPMIQPLSVENKVPAVWLTGSVSLVGGEVSSSEQQYGYATEQHVPFMTSEALYQSSIQDGRLVLLAGPYLDVQAKRPFVLPSTAAFVRRLSAEYYAAGCGLLVVTDAARLTSERPWGSSIHSVHPAGMAVDIRTRYIPIECADWLRAYVSQMEAEGKVDGTQEWKPEHLHLVVPLEPRGPYLVQVVEPTNPVEAP